MNRPLNALRRLFIRFAPFAVFCIFAAIVFGKFISPQLNAEAESDNSAPAIAKTEKNKAAPFNLETGAALNFNLGDREPTGFASEDINGDGFPDIVIGYRGESGGAIAVRLGNKEAFQPEKPETLEALRNNRFPAPFAAASQTIALPAPVDFIKTGDFNRDGKPDVIAAARNSAEVYLLDGSRNGFNKTRSLTVNGSVTALAVADLRNQRLGANIFLGVRDSAGAAKMLIYDFMEQSDSPATVIELPSAANSLTAAHLDADAVADLAVATEKGEILILHNSLGDKKIGTNQQSLEKLNLGIAAQDVAAGDFLADDNAKQELAVLTNDGTIRVLARGALNRRSLSQAETDRRANLIEQGDAAGLRKWESEKFAKTAPKAVSSQKWRIVENDLPQALSGQHFSPQSAKLVAGKMLDGAGDDLLIVDSSSGETRVLALGDKTAKSENAAVQPLTFASEKKLLAALPLRTSVMAQNGLVTLRADAGAPVDALIAAPAATFVVNTTTDAVDANVGDGVCATAASQCSLRAAISEANATPAADMITFSVNGNFSITLTGTNENNNLRGDFDVREDLTIVGNGAANTILTKDPAIAQRIIEFRIPGSGANNSSISNLTVRDGNNGVSGFGGGIRFDGFDVTTVSPDGSLSVSGVTVQNNTSANDGGGIWATAGTVSITNSTVSNNLAVEGDGGGISYVVGSGLVIEDAPLTVTNSSVRDNQALDNTDDATFFGRGGGILIRGAAIPNHTITNTTVSGNDAEISGGGVATENSTTVSGGSITNNSAGLSGNPPTSAPRGDGGGFWANAAFSGAATAPDNTISGVTLTGNEATGDGGAIFHDRGTLNVTASTIGGSGAGEGNKALNGGGIAHSRLQTLPTGFTPPELNIDSSSIVGNSASNTGGGIFNEAPRTLDLSGSVLNIGETAAVTISDNTAANGGGIFNSNGILSFTNGTVSGNAATAGKGGGIAHQGNSSSLVTQVVINNNTGSGIYISSSSSLDATSNTITGNSGDGITKIGGGTGSHFDKNTIHSNSELGIDLSDDNVTPNDPNDADAGPNNLQNFPVINSVRRSDGVANVTLNSPNGKYLIQYYANTTCDNSGHGEGELFLGSENKEIVSGNSITFDSISLPFNTREQITATATHDANGNGDFSDDGSSSEFSACRKVNALPTITAQNITRQQGAASSNSQIATVADADQTANSLGVAVNGGTSATVNGVTVSNVAVDASGNVSADVIASCSASTANFTLRATDNQSEFTETTLTVNVTANTAPTVGDYANTTVSTGSNATVTPSAAPADNGSIASATATASTGFTGTLSVNATTGAVTVNGAAPAGVYTIDVTLTDNCGASVTKQFTLTVNAVPTITPQNLLRQQGSPAENSQIATVSDANQNANTLTVTINNQSSATVNGVTVSSIAVNAAGVVTADVVASCSASNATFDVRVTDANGAFDQEQLTVTVAPNNSPTVGNYPNVSLTPGSGDTVAPNLAPSDNGSIASASVTTANSFTGTLSVDQSTGVVTIANANPYGTYTVTVTFTDNCGATTTRQFTLSVVDVTPPDTTIVDPKPANPSNSSTAVFNFVGEDGANSSGVASFECRLDAGAFVPCSSPQTYTNLSNGSHTFEVRAKDGAGNVDPSPASYTWTIDTIVPTVTINQAAGQPDPAVGVGATIRFTAVFSEPVTGFGNSPTDVTLSGSANATTATVTQIAPNDGTTYEITVSGMTQGGTVIASIPANAAQDAATNGNAASTSTDNEVTYIPNRPPVASPDSFATNEDTTLNVAAPGVLGNDSDPDAGDTLTAVLVSPPASGSLTLNPNGSFSYAPAANFNGSVSFSYKARDNQNAESAPVTVTINVNPVNDAPSFASGGNVTVTEDSGAYSAPWATAISKGPANESAQQVAFTVINNSNPGLFSQAPAVAPNGTLSFTPAPNAFGSAIITVVLTDNGGTANGGVDTSAPVNFTINVTPVNDAPVAAVVAGGSCGGSSGTMNLLVTDVDSPGGNLTLSGSSSNTAVVPNSGIVFGGSGSNRTVTISAVSRNNIQTAIVTITISDGQGGSSTTTINVIVGSNKSDTLNGTAGADLIFGDNGEDTINAGNGNDMVCGGNGNDTINGGDGDDTLNGENGNDVVRGDNGNDRLFGENGDDTLTGGTGADFFSGGNGNDTRTDFTSGDGDTWDNTLAEPLGGTFGEGEKQPD